MRSQYLLASLLILNVTSASAATFKASQPIVTQTSSALNFQGANIAPLVEIYQNSVRIVDQPFSVYNWSTGATDPFWQQDRPDDDPSLMAVAQRSSRSFWSGYGTASDSMYGWGLYAAEDPVATFSYGGSVSSFVLMRMQIPKNFRMLDLVYQPVTKLPDSVMKAGSALLAQFQCPANATPEVLFNQGGNTLDPKCKELVREVFQNQLKIDGFAYGYGATSFKDCKLNLEEYGQLAFVITSSTWMNSQSVRYFTPATKRNTEERVQIETLFLKATAQSQVKPSMTALVSYLDGHPESDLKSSVTRCDLNVCVITVHFCNKQNQCDDIALDPISRPFGAKIGAKEANLSTPGSVLWPDLLGMDKTPTISTWLQQNMYGCNGQAPYTRPIQNGGN